MSIQAAGRPNFILITYFLGFTFRLKNSVILCFFNNVTLPVLFQLLIRLFYLTVPPSFFRDRKVWRVLCAIPTYIELYLNASFHMNDCLSGMELVHSA
jgi:hypothetical protein